MRLTQFGVTAVPTRARAQPQKQKTPENKIHSMADKHKVNIPLWTKYQSNKFNELLLYG
jgi:hypothetical protein